MPKVPLRRRAVLKLGALASAALLSPPRLSRLLSREQAPLAPESFVGPFSSWTNLKTTYGAQGDGAADDTAALQTALDNLGDEGSSPVLWLPAGTYRITKTLEWTRTIGDGWMSILGEHPATTRIVWDGAPDGTMFKTHNINNSRFGRLTWDGSSRAAYAVQHTSSGSSSGNEHADEFFEHVGVGIRGGTMDTRMVAEMSVLRCRFVQCTRAGISVENPNSLDWWIWESHFQDCYVGVTSGYGQGAFHVFNSLFERSTFADTLIGFASYYVLADNVSRSSRAFCLASFSWNPLELVIQRNTILDPTLGPNPPEPRGGGLDKLFSYELLGPIAVKYYGPLLLLDNVIRSRPNHTAPVVEIGQDMVAIGNTFTVAKPLLAGERLIEFDNRIRPRHDIIVPPQSIPEPPPLFAGKVFEVSASASAAQIQTQIDAAAKAGERAVVHLPYGTYALTQPLVVPANSELQIVGDGRTRLDWMGGADGVALDVRGPTHATFRDFVIRQSNNQATGLRASNVDQVGARVWMQGVQVRGQKNGLLADGLDNTVIELRDFQIALAFYDTPSAMDDAAVHVRGGAQRTRVLNPGGRVNWFSGASSGTLPNFRVERGGALLVRALWYEGRAPFLAHLDDAGEFTVLGALFARYAETLEVAPVLTVENFRGKAALLSVHFMDASSLGENGMALRINGVETSQVLLLGASGGMERMLQIENNSKSAQAALVMNRAAQKIGDYVLARPDEWKGTPSALNHFLREMLEPARRIKPVAPSVLPESASDLRFYRVYVLGFETAMEFRKDN